MSDDPQDQAEAFDEEVIGGEGSAITSDVVPTDVVPDELHGVPFADADVTDESISDRILQEEPEVWEQAPSVDADSDIAADERLEQIIDLSEQP